jgi:hypothetical protein
MREPVGRRPLGIRVDHHDGMPVTGHLASQIDGDGRFAAATLQICDRDERSHCQLMIHHEMMDGKAHVYAVGETYV